MINTKIEIVVAHANNLVIGNNGKLPWPYNKEDMRRFRELTLGQTCVVGRKTWESILKLNPKADPQQPLKGRNCIILSKNNFLFNPLEKILSTYDKIMVIGGEQIYKLFLPFATTLHVTQIYGDYLGDTFFPEYRDGEWECVFEEEKSDLKFFTYVRSKTLKLL